MTGRSARAREIAPLVAAAVGLRLRQQRERRGMSQHGLARRVGCDSTLINRYESGRRLPNVAMVVALAEAIDCPPADLLPEGPR